MKVLFSFLLTSLFCFQLGNAQQLTKEHRVKKGETVYQLSRIYNVSPQDIIKLNPSSAKVIYVDEILIIPSNAQQNSANTQIQTSNQFQSISHHVLKGETKYGLSKKYGITIAELEKQNPHIKNGLQAGHYLSIRSSNIQPPATINNQNTTYKSHYVQKGETLYSLSKKYQVTIQEIKSANPQLGILKYGTTIAIPSTEMIADSNQETIETDKSIVEETSEIITEKEPLNPENTEEEKTESVTENPIVYENYTIKPKETLYSLSKQANMSMEDFVDLNPQLEKSVQAGTVIKMPRSVEILQTNPIEEEFQEQTSKNEYANLTKTLDKNAQKKILFVMPFNENEFNNVNTSEEFTNVPFNRNLEFYEGAKIAMDSLQKLGVGIKSEIIEIDIETTVTPSNIRSQNSSLDGYDVVFAPSYSDNIDWLISAASDKKIPVITVYNASNNNNLDNIIEAYPSVEIQKLKMLDYLKTHQGNIIVISDHDREASKNFIITNAKEAKIIETRKNGNYSSRELSNLLDKSKLNYVIIDSDKNGVFLNTTNTLLRELSNYKIQLAVLEKNLIPSEEDISIKRFTILKMLYPDVTYTNSTSVNRFNSNYTSKNGQKPSTTVLEGFDITFDTLLRLCQANGYSNIFDKERTAHTALEFNYKNQESGRKINDIVIVNEFKSEDSTN